MSSVLRRKTLLLRSFAFFFFILLLLGSSFLCDQIEPKPNRLNKKSRSSSSSSGCRFFISSADHHLSILIEVHSIAEKERDRASSMEEEQNRLYPKIQFEEEEEEDFNSLVSRVSSLSPVYDDHDYDAHTTQTPISLPVNNAAGIKEYNDNRTSSVTVAIHKPETGSRDTEEEEEEEKYGGISSVVSHKKQGKYFCYESPLLEETGTWIPVSVPPMWESQHDCNGSNGDFFPEDDMGWSQFVRENKELTMWDVVHEMLLAAQGKLGAIASGDFHSFGISWVSCHLLEQTWNEMAQTLTDANFGNVNQILETEPPRWDADSSAASCMLCSVRFHALMCSRHHCRFCGGIFCSECSKGRSLLPVKFRTGNPERVCDSCSVRLEPVQSYLMDRVSRAAQLPTHDLTDLSTLRSWVNFPWGQSMEYEIYKATNTILGYNKVGLLKSERSIPRAILQQAKGLAIITVVKVGVMVTYNIGTGLVIARREDGSWSPPSAISSFGVGWGAQAGGELTDFIIVLRTKEAVKTFSGNMHFSVGAGLSAAVGVLGREAAADVRAGDGGYAACYTYSCSKGAFVGCSLEGSIVTTRTLENSRFYGSSSISASDILLGKFPRPPAAAILYNALSDLFQKLER